MDFESKMLKVNSLLKSQLPASCADETIRKIVLIYYLYLKLYHKCSDLDLQATAEATINAIENPVNILDSDVDNSAFTLINHIAKYKDEFIKTIKSGVDDFVFYCNDSCHSSIFTQITYIFRDIEEECMLAFINSTFENSFRDDSTPDSVSELVLKLANYYSLLKEKVTDMTCSSGSFLIKAAKQFKRAEGIEINAENANLAKIRMVLNGIQSDIRNANCFEDSWHHQTSLDKSDLVFAEFPWKLIVKDYGLKELMLNCNANRLNLNLNSSTDYFFLSAMMNYLKDDGVAITVMPLSSLSNLADRDVRKYIIRKGYLKEVIALPSNIFCRTSIQTAVVVLTLKPNERVAFFDGTQFFKQEKRKTNTINVNDLLTEFEKAKQDNRCFYNFRDIEEKDYSFSPAHYLNKFENSIPNSSVLSSYAEIFTGWQVPSAKLEAIHRTDGSGTKLLQMSNIENGCIVSKLEKYDIPENTIDKFTVKKGDVVISTKSLKVKSAVLEINSDDAIVAAGSIMVIRPMKGKLDPYYLVAYFESDLGKQVLEMYQSGNIIPNLSINNVKKLPMPGLDFEKQKLIGSKYRDLRDLIQSERERLKSLESKVNKILDNLWDMKEGD